MNGDSNPPFSDADGIVGFMPRVPDVGFGSRVTACLNSKYNTYRHDSSRPTLFLFLMAYPGTLLWFHWDEQGIFSAEQKTIDSDVSCENLGDLFHYTVEFMQVSCLFIARTLMLEYYNSERRFSGFRYASRFAPFMRRCFFLHNCLVTCAQSLQSFFIDAKIAYYDYFDADWGTFTRKPL